jgi:hypothetical protein
MIKCMGSPQSRMSHVSGIYGGCLIIYGGYNGSNNEILGDF